MIKKIKPIKNKEYSNHKEVIYFEDKKVGLYGYVALHSKFFGKATGGTRLYPYKNKGEALEDVLKLSKAMTYKSVFIDIPFGGGKAVIIASKKQKTQEMMKSYALIINSLKGKYTTGTDVGITDEDTEYMSTLTPYILKGTYGHTTTSLMAAKGVYESIIASYKTIFPKKKISDMAIAIKGVGKLGRELVRLLYKKNVKIIVADIDKKITDKIKKEFPKVKVVNPKEIHRMNVDVYSPCAMGNEFNKKNIKELNCSIIVGGANNQFTNEEDILEVCKKGIWYIPDYVVNSGGLIQIVDELYKGGYNNKRVKENIKVIAKSVAKLIKESKKTGLFPFQIAQKIIREKLQKNKK